MNTNLRFSDALQYMGDIPPQTLNNTNDSTIWMDMRTISKMGIVLAAGAIAGGGSVSLLVRQATDAAGAGSKVVLAALDVIVFTDADDNKQVMVDIDQVDLDHDNGFAFVQITLTETGSFAALVQAAAYGIGSGYAPGTDLSSVITKLNANPNQ